MTLTRPPTVGEPGTEAGGNWAEDIVFTFTELDQHDGERLRNRGDWTTGTAYAVNDLVRAGGAWWLVLAAHTSSGSAPTVDTAQYQKFANPAATGGNTDIGATILAQQISDATPLMQTALRTATTPAQARAAFEVINMVLGTAATTAAAGNDVVRLLGNIAQTITGQKTFSTPPVVPDGSFTTAKIAAFQSAVDARVQAYRYVLEASQTLADVPATVPAGAIIFQKRS